MSGAGEDRSRIDIPHVEDDDHAAWMRALLDRMSRLTRAVTGARTLAGAGQQRADAGFGVILSNLDLPDGPHESA